MRNSDRQPWYADIEAYIDERDRLRTGFSRTTPTQTRRLVMRHFGAMTYKDIAVSEGVTTEAARYSCLRGEYNLARAFGIWPEKD